MDELAAEKISAEMDVDDNTEKDLEQRDLCGSVIADAASLPAAEVMTENKEINLGHAAVCELEDVASKVQITARKFTSQPCAQHLT